MPGSSQHDVNNNIRGLPEVPPNSELAYGTRVPQLENYNDSTIAEGVIIQSIETLWNCEDASHRSELGSNTVCWIDPVTQQHHGINNRMKKKWAKAVIAGNTTTKEPPNTEEFDIVRNGRPLARARGRTGPYAAQTQPPTTDITAAALLVLTVKSLGDRFEDSSSRRRRRRSPSPPSSAPPSSPPKVDSVTDIESIIRTCPDKFFLEHHCDLRGSLDELKKLEFTPDVIPDVTVTQLVQVTQASEGAVIKFQRFCRDTMEKKKRRRTSY
ncbi:hypothetical protein VKT23_014617 [Stygiomarasmius scandens]|uniref:Uncharacterized protein n=1 Tax=Marasmiellus scandens TaxID=2682957 RepID=A0ABR1J276_9AGAR